jgi:hypothetical protein
MRAKKGAPVRACAQPEPVALIFEHFKNDSAGNRRNSSAGLLKLLRASGKSRTPRPRQAKTSGRASLTKGRFLLGLTDDRRCLKSQAAGLRTTPRALEIKVQQQPTYPFESEDLQVCLVLERVRDAFNK